MVIQKQRFAIVDRRAPAIARPLSLLFLLHLHPHRNKRFLVGLHQGTRQLISLCLRIESVSSRRVMLHKGRTDIDMGWLISGQSGDMNEPLR